jgi:hypothetical protein
MCRNFLHSTTRKIIGEIFIAVQSSQEQSYEKCETIPICSHAPTNEEMKNWSGKEEVLL